MSEDYPPGEWVRFVWDLRRRPSPPQQPTGYDFTSAYGSEEEKVITVVIAAYASDPIWAPMMDGIRSRMTARVTETFATADVTYLVARRSGEIVGVSGVAKSHWTEQNLLTGLCVLGPHQRRGIGTRLLYESLARLRDLGTDRAVVYTEEGSIADRKLYPKFGSSRQPHVLYPALTKPPPRAQS